MKKIAMLICMMFAFLILVSCGNDKDNFSQSIEWERGTISGTYTLAELGTMSMTERDALKKKFISIEFVIESYSTLEGLFYINVFKGAPVSLANSEDGEWFDIECYVYAPYWEIDCEVTDTVIIEGFVEFANRYQYTSSFGRRMRLNPCDIRKK